MSDASLPNGYFREGDILPTSRPYIKIDLGPVHWGSNQDTSIYSISTVLGETGTIYDLNGRRLDRLINDNSAVIVSADIEGIAATPDAGRQGTIRIKDPIGVWPERIGVIGKVEGSMLGPSGPNIKITYGWVGLRPGTNRYKSSVNNSNLQTIVGMISEVKFDIEQDGVVMIELNFIQFGAAAIDFMTFYDINDTIIGSPEEILIATHNSNNTKVYSPTGSLIAGGNADPPTPIDILNYVINQNSEFSVAEQLRDKKTIIAFKNTDSTGTKWEVSEASSLSDIPRIEFGVSVGAWMKKLLSKITLTDNALRRAENQGVTVTYSRLGEETDPDTGVTIIEYGWMVMENPTAPDVTDDNLRMMEHMQDVTHKACTLYWKGNATHDIIEERDQETIDRGIKYDVDKKRLLSWTSNLTSYTQLWRLFDQALKQELNDLKNNTEYDIEELIEELKQVPQGLSTGEWLNIGNMALAGAPPASYNRGGGWSLSETAASYTSVISRLQREMQEIAKGENLPVRNQSLTSIMLKNFFEGDAEIMGDPTLGSVHLVFKSMIETDFSFVTSDVFTNSIRLTLQSNGISANQIDNVMSNFADAFSRNWLLSSVSHHFSESGEYTTKLKLLGFPALTSADGEYEAP